MARSASELSEIAKEKAAQGQPTLSAARVQARPIMASAAPESTRPLMASVISEPAPVKVVAVQAAPVQTVPVKEPVRMAQVQARPIETRPIETPKFARVMARPIMGQAPAAAPGQTTLTRDEATLILQGLTETLKLADGARTTGWRCTGVDDATFYKGRVLRDRLANYLGFPDPSGAGFAITKDEADVADKILGCSNEATAASSDKTAWYVLGAIVVGAAIFFSVTARSK